MAKINLRNLDLDNLDYDEFDDIQSFEKVNRKSNKPQKGSDDYNHDHPVKVKTKRVKEVEPEEDLDFDQINHDLYKDKKRSTSNSNIIKQNNYNNSGKFNNINNKVSDKPNYKQNTQNTTKNTQNNAQNIIKPEPLKVEGQYVQVIKSASIDFARLADIQLIESEHNGAITYGVNFLFAGKKGLNRIIWFNQNKWMRDKVYIEKKEYWEQVKSELGQK